VLLLVVGVHHVRRRDDHVAGQAFQPGLAAVARVFGVVVDEFDAVE